MVVLKYLLPAFAAGQLAFAAHCGGGGKIQIASQGDADAFDTCQTLKGDVEISKHATNMIQLNGVEQITGSLICKDAVHLTNLVAPQLNSIADTLHLNGLTRLTNLQMDSLSSVGSIKFTALPNLQTLGFTTGVSKANDVNIVNTDLVNLNGINLESVGTFVVTNNVRLQQVNVNELSNATGLINFAGNMEGLSIDFPNLVSGSNMTFYNVSSVAVPSLHKLTGQLGFWGNKFKSFNAPNLTTSSDVTFVGNDELRNISMPVLQRVNGGFLITRNDALKDISFPRLDTISGALDFSGEFDHVSLPSLNDVQGGFNMQSTGNFQCSTFHKLRENKVIRGSYKCKAKAANPTTKSGSSGATGTGGSSGGGSSSGSGSKGAASSNVANMPAMGLAAVLGSLVQYVL